MNDKIDHVTTIFPIFPFFPVYWLGFAISIWKYQAISHLFYT